eukprot:10082459-Heterocapsa_arctica.AAC.1
MFSGSIWTLKLICWAKWSAFCEDSNGDSEDARRPFKHLQQQSLTFKHLQRHIHLSPRDNPRLTSACLLRTTHNLEVH